MIVSILTTSTVGDPVHRSLQSGLKAVAPI
jgi:hypothetical protein